MDTQLYIDSNDIFATYGATMRPGNLARVLSVPPFKPSSINVNDWHEIDGAEAELLSPVLAGRTVRLEFTFRDIAQNGYLLADLSDGAYHTFEFPDIDTIYTLRLVSYQTYTHLNGGGTVALELADDFPPQFYASQTYPLASGFTAEGYVLDGYDIGAYGVRVLEGTAETFRKPSATRRNLTVDTRSSAGLVYDPETVTFASRTAVLRLFARCRSIGDFKDRRDALMHALLQPGLRSMMAGGWVYECYYNSADVTEFANYYGIWCKMDVRLNIINWAEI